MSRNSVTWRIVDNELAERFRGYARYGLVRQYRANELIYSQGDVERRFFYILSGSVHISMVSHDGSDITLETMGPDGLFGEGPAFDGMPRYTSVSALVPTSVIVFDAADTYEAVRQDPSFFADLLAVMGLKQRILATKLENFAARDPKLRIVELLVRLSAMFGVPRDGGFIIQTDLTHEQVASMTGTSRVTVTRVLTRMRQQGQIKQVGHHIWIPSRDFQYFI